MQMEQGRSNKAILEECRRILRETPPNEQVSDPKDFNFLLSAFSLAPYWEEKTRGQKIVGIKKDRSGWSYNNYCFYLLREDGTETDFSFNKMFRKDPALNDILLAARQAVAPVISEFRKTFKPFVFEGYLVEREQEVDVDHYDKTFRELCAIWIEKHGGVGEIMKCVNRTDDGDTKTCFTQEELVQDFVAFHNANTHLRFLPKKVNRSRTYDNRPI